MDVDVATLSAHDESIERGRRRGQLRRSPRSSPFDEFQLLAQGRQSADCIALESVGQIVREVPPVRDLQRTRCATALGARVHAISVAADHLASRMLIQPLNECI